MEYLSTFLNNSLSIFFIIFIVIALGYWVGSIKIGGISLGSAGVLLIALLYGFLASKIPELQISGQSISLFNSDIKTKLSFLSSIGTVIFVTSIGFIAGPKFFRCFNKNTINYVLIGIIIVLSGCGLTFIFKCIDKNINTSMLAGLMAGGLTSTPGLSAAKEAMNADPDLIVSGYGIAYLFGVFGVVLFVQIMPKLLHANMEEERLKVNVGNQIVIPELSPSVRRIDNNGLFGFVLAIALGCLIGSFYIPGVQFSLGNSGGCLFAGLIIGHFQHIGNIDLRVDKKALNVLRELGLVLFLTGSGINGGVNFINNVRLSYFFYGAIITLVPMIVGYLFASKIFHLPLLNALGAITGGMTSTPALGAILELSKSDDVASVYATTYPVAMAMIVILIKLIVMFL